MDLKLNAFKALGMLCILAVVILFTPDPGFGKIVSGSLKKISALSEEECTSQFYPDPSWKNAYPACSGHSQIDDCGVDPALILEGGSCFPSVGEHLIGKIIVSGNGITVLLFEAWAIDGIVEVLLLEEL
jgi:hypothetical protein